MYIGHVAAGLALKRAVPNLRLGVILFAALLPDFLLGLFVVLGLEGITVPADFDNLHYLTYDFPYSHGLTASLFWALIVSGVAWIASRQTRIAVVLGMAVLSHFFLDMLVHIPELPVLGSASFKLGLGLRENFGLSLAVEGVLAIAALVLYLTAGWAKQQGLLTNIVLVLFVVLLSLYVMGGQWIVPAPPNAEIPAIYLMVQTALIAGIVFWMVPPVRIMTPAERTSFVNRLAELLSGKGRFRKQKRTNKPKTSAAEAAQKAVEEIPDEPEDIWPMGRIEIAEEIWGESYLSPGGEAFFLEKIQLLGLTEAHSLLNVGAGLGGPARSLATTSGIWVTGLESIPELAELAHYRSKKDQLDKKASINEVDFETVKLKKKSYNAVASLETFMFVKDKERLFAEIQDSLRDNCTFLFTDYVLTATGQPSDTVLEWFQREPVKPNLWSAKQTVEFLNSMNFEVRVSENITQDYKTMVLQAWLDYVGTLNKSDIRPDMADFIIDECEYWLRRIAALDTGDVGVYRFDVSKSPESRR